MTSCSTLIETMHASCQNLVKLPILIYPTRPTCTWLPFGVNAYEFHQHLWHQKTRVTGRLSGIYSHLAISVEHQLVTDTQTDGHMTAAYTMIAYSAAW